MVVFVIVGAHQLHHPVVPQGVDAEGLGHLVADLAAQDHFQARLAVDLHIFHAGKAAAVALDDGHIAEVLPNAVKDVRPQGLFAGGPQKDNGFVLRVTVQIGQLHRLLVGAGGGGGVGGLVCQQQFNLRLQLVVFLRLLGQGIELLRALEQAAGQGSAPWHRPASSAKLLFLPYSVCLLSRICLIIPHFF